MGHFNVTEYDNLLMQLQIPHLIKNLYYMLESRYCLQRAVFFFSFLFYRKTPISEEYLGQRRELNSFEGSEEGKRSSPRLIGRFMSSKTNGNPHSMPWQYLQDLARHRVGLLCGAPRETGQGNGTPRFDRDSSAQV